MNLYRIPDTVIHTHNPESPLAMCIRCMLDMHIADGQLVAAIVSNNVLYAEPYGCRHRTLMYVHGADICSDCGAAQRWVVRVWPEKTE